MKSETTSIPSPGLAGDLKDPHAWPDGLDIAVHRGEVELDDFGQIHFGDERGIGGVEDGGILERLVLAFGGGERTKRICSPRS